MFFSTIWAFLIGKNAIENGIKDYKLSKWSRNNAVSKSTNTYIDAKGMTRDADTGAVVFLKQDMDGHTIGTDIFGNKIKDYTIEKQRQDFIRAQENRDEFHTTALAIGTSGKDLVFKDLDDPTKEYVIREIVIAFVKGKLVKNIPVYVDKRTSMIVRPIDEYMEFISHSEFYEGYKTSLFVIRDMDIINAIIKKYNASFIPGDLNANFKYGIVPNYREIVRWFEREKEFYSRAKRNEALRACDRNVADLLNQYGDKVLK